MILKSQKENGTTSTSVFPNDELSTTIIDLYASGYRNIHDPETGTTYAVCCNNHAYSVSDSTLLDPCDIPF